MSEEAERWWEPNVKPDLSQGDVVLSLPFWVPLPADPPLEKVTLKGGRTVWNEAQSASLDENGIFHLLGRARLAPGIVLTHDCEIDKKRKNNRIQVAILLTLDRLNASERAVVMGQGKYAHMVLPDIPVIGTRYVDFQVQVTLDRRVIDARPRTASMSDQAVQRLRAQLVAYFLRLELA